MDPLKSNNIVAKILQVYAYLNVIAGCILAYFVACEQSELIGIVMFAVTLISSFFIYALGEIIDLLHRIKCNTDGTVQNGINEELPDL